MFSCLPLGHCCVIDPIVLHQEFWRNFLFQVYATSAVQELASFTVEPDAPLPQDACTLTNLLGVAEYSYDSMTKKSPPQLVVQRLCSGGSSVSYKCRTLAWLGWTSGVLWVGALICIPKVAAVG